MRKITIRQAQDADEPWFRKEWEESQKQLFANEDPITISLSEAYTQNALNTDLDGLVKNWVHETSNFFVGVDAQTGERLGTASVKLIDKENRIAEIMRVWTHVNSRGLGIAKQLVIACENWARDTLNCKTIILETSSAQVAACNMYIKLGYSLVFLSR
jgi:ribosomal protein S18 acetylase RimI-like enzyme